MARRERNLTKAFIDKLQPEEKKFRVWDTTNTSLFLFVMPSGIKTFYLRVTINGKSTDKKLGRYPTFMPDSARKFAKQMPIDIAMGRYENKTTCQTLKAACDDYRHFMESRNKRAIDYQIKLIEDIFSEWWNKPIDFISSERIETFIKTAIAKKYAPATINRRVGALKAALAVQVDKGNLNSNPIKKHHNLQVPKKARTRILSEEEKTKLIETLEAPKKDHEFAYQRYYVWCALYLTARPNSIKNLLWSDVDFQKEEIHFHSEFDKNGNHRIEPIIAPLLAKLREWREQNNEVFVFPSPRKHGYPIANPTKGFNALLKRAGLRGDGIEDCVRYTFRHHVLTELIIKTNGNLALVSEITGTSMKTLHEHYLHAKKDDKRDAMMLLN